MARRTLLGGVMAGLVALTLLSGGALLSGQPRAEAAGPPAQVSITASAPVIVCGFSSTIIVNVRDASNAPVDDGTLVTFTTNFGGLAGSARTTGGVAVAVFTSLSGFPGAATITATAGGVSAQTTVQVVCAPLFCGVVTGCAALCAGDFAACFSACAFTFSPTTCLVSVCNLVGPGACLGFTCGFNVACAPVIAPALCGFNVAGCLGAVCGLSVACATAICGTNVSCLSAICGFNIGCVGDSICGFGVLCGPQPPPVVAGPAVVPLFPGPGARIAFAPFPNVGTCGSLNNIEVFVTDANGLPVANGTTVNFTTSLGSITPTATTVAGKALVRLTIDPKVSGTAIIRATSGASSAEKTFPVTCG